MLKRIHVNQHHIKHNSKHPEKKPVFSVKTSKANHRGFEVKINGPSAIVYSPDKPLNCGAKAWIETRSAVELDGLAID